jgi:hypothetical protein
MASGVITNVGNGQRKGQPSHRTNGKQQFCSQFKVAKFLKHGLCLLTGLAKIERRSRRGSIRFHGWPFENGLTRLVYRYLSHLGIMIGCFFYPYNECIKASIMPLQANHSSRRSRPTSLLPGFQNCRVATGVNASDSGSVDASSSTSSYFR